MPFPISEDQLTQTESQLGAKLPIEYRKSMEIDNGGEASTAEDHWFFYPIKNTLNRKVLSRTCNHILSETESCKDYGYFPANALAIAGNGSGDQMVFLKEKDKYLNKVYRWCHETGDISELATTFSEITKT